MRKNDSHFTTIHDYSIDLYNREIYLHSMSGNEDEESGVDYRSSICLIKNLRYLDSQSYDPIIIHMHIPGGNWCDCTAMHDAIKLCGSPIGIIVYSRAESCGSVIIQAADLRIMAVNSYMLIHYGSTTIDGDHKVAMSNLKWSQQEANKMVDIFTDKFIDSPMTKNKKWSRNIAKKHIISQLDNKADWILYPNEAIDYGFADGVLGGEHFEDITSIKNKLKAMYT